MPMRKRTNTKTVARKPGKDPIKDERKRGNPPFKTEYEDATENVSAMKEGGICRGAGAAIKGTNFKGVF
jgi:hypothetical protein